MFLKPYYIWDDLEITIYDVKVFKCRISVFKYNCRWERDPVCMKALQAIEAVESKIKAALAPPQHHMEAMLVDLSPAKHMIFEITEDLPLPPSAAEEVLSIFLDTVMSIDCVREILDSILAGAVGKSQPSASAALQDVVEPHKESSCVDLELRESVQIEVDRSLEKLPDYKFLQLKLSELMTRTLLEVTAKKHKKVRAQLTASKLMLGRFEDKLHTARKKRLFAEETSRLIITSLTANLPISHKTVSEESVISFQI